MDANLTCSPPVKNLTDGEQRSAFRGIFRGQKTDQRKITVGNYTRGVEKILIILSSPQLIFAR